MGVLAMLEIDGDPEALLAAGREMERLRPGPEGVLMRMTAATDTGIVLFQLWETAEARAANQQDPAHREALEASGLKALARGMRSRTFENAELSHASMPG